VVAALSAVVALVGAACSSNVSSGAGSGPSSSSSATGAPGLGGSAIGFIFVGPKNDYGYNQAAYDGSQAVKAAFPSLKVLTAENVLKAFDALPWLKTQCDNFLGQRANFLKASAKDS